MLRLLWRRLRRRARRTTPPAQRTCCSFPPQFDPLEDRLLLAARPFALPNAGPALPHAGAANYALPHVPSPPMGGAWNGGNPIKDRFTHNVTVGMNSPDTVIDVVALLTGLGVTDAGARSLYVTGNSNPGLVSATLGNDELTLHYARGQIGTATITVEAVDRFGESIELIVQVKVLPPTPGQG